MTVLSTQKFKVWQPTYIHPTAKIGEGSVIAKFCDIGKNVLIGKNCNIQTQVSISNYCIIGNNVFLGPKVTLLNDKYINGKIQPVIIEDGARIGGATVILPNVRVGKGALIGAGSCVTKNVEAQSVVFGNPARKRK